MNGVTSKYNERLSQEGAVYIDPYQQFLIVLTAPTLHHSLRWRSQAEGTNSYCILSMLHTLDPFSCNVGGRKIL